MCEWGYGRCTAPNTECPHWIGCICELDFAFYNFENVTITILEAEVKEDGNVSKT